ncbi:MULTISPECIES: hypothetical protein [unclassified Neisseria]|uniref:hypothetical protein n=1 Tax=unclassified Neisseria TaxID=2623750 RepID=UPI001072A2BC|nr:MULTISPECIES: hypothetical protein [unclassified Neisseria]MBF0803107.1 hypothetical protein [Neisseria sp. 19428wB4_WF04]TFU44231.1 hypothetical protein E4T99_01840 [Neisseria sp. WF04]
MRLVTGWYPVGEKSYRPSENISKDGLGELNIADGISATAGKVAGQLPKPFSGMVLGSGIRLVFCFMEHERKCGNIDCRFCNFRAVCLGLFCFAQEAFRPPVLWLAVYAAGGVLPFLLLPMVAAVWPVSC